MRITTVAALAAALIAPLAAGAQVAAPPVAQPPVTTVGPGRITNPGQQAYHHWMRRLQGINLSPQQQQQVQSALTSFANAHPAGSPKDPAGSQALHNQIYSILSPQQQAQLRANTQAMHQQDLQRQAQRQPMAPQPPVQAQPQVQPPAPPR